MRQKYHCLDVYKRQVPQFPANATAKNYAISDTLSDGLTFNSNSLKVYGITADDHETELVNGTTTYYVQSNQRPNSGGTSTFTLTFNYAEISLSLIHIFGFLYRYPSFPHWHCQNQNKFPRFLFGIHDYNSP